MNTLIAQVQEILTRLGYLDGAYAPNELDEPTRAALRLFQGAHGLRITGEADDHTVEELRAADAENEWVVIGQVKDDGGPIEHAIIAVRDRDLGNPADWPELGRVATDGEGRFTVRYRPEAVHPGDARSGSGAATPDLVFAVLEAPVAFDGFFVERLPEKVRVPDDEVALGIQARRVEQVRLVVSTRTPRPRQSEYARLLTAFHSIWPDTNPADLDDANREPAFVARELDEPEPIVNALVAAWRLHRRPFDGTVSAEILYGLARGEPAYPDVPALAGAGARALKLGIVQSRERGIIAVQHEEEIAQAIERIIGIAPAHALPAEAAEGGAPTLAAVLAPVLDSDAREALVRVAAEHKEDPPALWQALRHAPAFAEPGLIERAQVALGLDALTGRHLPLIKVLQEEEGLRSLGDLLDMDRTRLLEIVQREGVGVPDWMPDVGDTPRAEAFVDGLRGRLQQAQPTHTIAATLRALPAEHLGGEVATATAAVLDAAATEALRTQGESFDVRSSRVEDWLAAHPDILAAVNEPLRPHVTAMLKRAQRLYRVSSGADSFDWLWRQGFRSAHDIAQVPAATFIMQAGGEIGEAAARLIHGQAVTINNTMTTTHLALAESVADIYPDILFAGPDRVVGGDESAGDVIARFLPTWSSLFGATQWCDCAHCRSVYSPAAYLVDLLNMLDKLAKNASGKSPLEVLLARRPDLAHLPLTCENTNTLIPYVDLVNEILEFLVSAGDFAGIPAHDTAGATSAEQLAQPQYMDRSAYITPANKPARLDRAIYSWSLPFDAPLQAMRSDLGFLSVKRAELLDLFGAAAHDRAAESLGLSPAQWEAITGVTLAGTPSDLAETVRARFGLEPALLPHLSLDSSGPLVWLLKDRLQAAGQAVTPSAGMESEILDAATDAALRAFQSASGLAATGTADAATWQALDAVAPLDAEIGHLPILLDRTGLTYSEIEMLLQTQALNPEFPNFVVLAKLDLPAADLIAWADGGLGPLPPALDAALVAVGVNPGDFVTWAQGALAPARWTALRRTIVIDGPPGDDCDLSAARLRCWDPVAPDLTPADWLRFDRFVRLQRGASLDAQDLDTLLASLRGAPGDSVRLDADALVTLADALELARGLDLPPADVALLWSDLDPLRPASFYAGHFLGRGGAHPPAAFVPDPLGRVLSGATVGEHADYLRATLRLRAADLATLRTSLGLESDASALDIPALSNVVRHVLLARALELPVADLLRLRDLAQIDPFVPPTTGNWQTSHFVSAARALKDTGVSSGQLAWLLNDVAAEAGVTNEARDARIADMREGLQAIAAANDAASSATAEGDLALVRRALAALGMEAGRVEAILQVLTGTTQTTVALASALPASPVIPQMWQARLRYDKQANTLTVTGVLSDTERQTVRNFAAAAAWKQATDAAYGAPRSTLAATQTSLAAHGIGFGDPDALLAAALPDDPSAREAALRARLAPILVSLLPAMRDRLGRSFVNQTFIAAGWTPDAVALLLDGRRTDGKPVLPAQDAGQTIMADWLRLATEADATPAIQADLLLTRLRLLTDTLELPAADLRALVGSVVNLRPDPMHLTTFADWERVAAYAGLRRPGQPPGRLAALWEATDLPAADAILADVFGWPAGRAQEIANAQGLILSDLQDVLRLATLPATGALLGALGVPAKVATEWAQMPADWAQADALRNAIQTRYDEKAWLEAVRPLTDAQRDARRAALVDYLLPRLGLQSSADLYQALLIDVEMGSCMETSRIKQAISSVQQFVERILLNREPDVSQQAIDPDLWGWMKVYRVWEANRKVLLYPENWILPELREDKTPYFKELESALLQDDVTDAAAERSLLAYLEKLDTVARLEIVGLHVQRDFAADESFQTVVHLVGRTANTPRTHHYRRFEVKRSGSTNWTAWESVPLDIEDAPVVLVTYNRRLYLFWATETVKPPANPTKAGDPQQIEVRLCWSEYRDGAWSPKHVSAPNVALTEKACNDVPGLTQLGTPRPPGVIERMEARVSGETLTVRCIGVRDIILTDDKKQVCYSNPFTFGPDGAMIPRDGNMAYTFLAGTFTMENCHAQLLEDDNPMPIWDSDGYVLRVHDGLEVKPVSRSPSRKPTPLLDLTSDGMWLAEDAWVHDGDDYFAVGDRDRVYLANVWPTIDLRGMLEGPERALPSLVDERPKLGPRLDQQVSIRPDVLAANKQFAAKYSDRWATATQMMASPVLAGVSLPGGITPQQLMGVPAPGALPGDPSLRKAMVELAIDGAASLQGTRSYRYAARFETLFHPYTCVYMARVRQYGVEGLMRPANQGLGLAPEFRLRYRPEATVVAPYPMEGVDFGATVPGAFRTSAYSNYNWEIFFHIPMLIADRLAQNRRFEEALRWMHFVFNPTDGRGGYWKVLPFRSAPIETLHAWLKRLHAGDADVLHTVADWIEHPFQPHRVARMRLMAYMKFVVMRYLDVLIAWADQLFARDTIESINQAMQLYILAGEMLGPRRSQILSRGEPAPLTFADMRGKLDALGDVMAEFENVFPALTSAAPAPATAGLLGISRSLYFCLPSNDKLLGYWDTVADRLFKIRNCMNLAGVVRKLPLFEPPIDPALLVRAAAQGLDIGSVLSELAAPLPPRRFEVVLRRALDACADVKALGGLLLAALEKKDAEALSALRAGHESALVKSMLAIRTQQESEAQAQIEVLTVQRATAVERLRHYRGLMGIEQADPKPGETIQAVPYNPKPAAEGGVFLIQEEKDELDAAHSARDWQVRAGFMEMLASASYYIPTLSLELGTMGSATITMVAGGQHVAPALKAIASYQEGLSKEDAYDASHAGKMATYKRRQQEYAFQANLAAREIMLIDKQTTAAEIRKAIAQAERRHVETQLAQAAEIEAFLATKFTRTELYGWLQGQAAGLYFQSHALAAEVARQAERCFRFETGIEDGPGFITGDSWDSLHKGLLAGERLHLQLKQLERAWLEHTPRELELTRTISLRAHDPLALIRLQQTGQCEFELPELLFDMDYPGHYMRRIKSVSLTIPAVVGPYEHVNATLTLLSSETRMKPALDGAKYARRLDTEDPRFRDNFTGMDSIATSSGINDSGLFERSLRDERYLPFEGAGAASRWRIRLDPAANHFDLGVVSDVVITLLITVRDGGERLRTAARAEWQKRIAESEGMPLQRLFSLKHEFPGEWHRFRTRAQANGDHVETIVLDRNHFPFLFRTSTLHVTRVDLFGVPAQGMTVTRLPELRPPQAADALEMLGGAPIKPLFHQTATVEPAWKVQDAPEKSGWELRVSAAEVAATLDTVDDLLILCEYTVKMPTP